MPSNDKLVPLKNPKPYDKCWAIFDEYPPWPGIICTQDKTEELRKFYGHKGIGVLCLADDDEYVLVHKKDIFDYDTYYERFKDGVGVGPGIQKIKDFNEFPNIEFVAESTDEEIDLNDGNLSQDKKPTSYEPGTMKDSGTHTDSESVLKKQESEMAHEKKEIQLEQKDECKIIKDENERVSVPEKSEIVHDKKEIESKRKLEAESVRNKKEIDLKQNESESVEDKEEIESKQKEENELVQDKKESETVQNKKEIDLKRKVEAKTVEYKKESETVQNKREINLKSKVETKSVEEKKKSDESEQKEKTEPDFKGEPVLVEKDQINSDVDSTMGTQHEKEEPMTAKRVRIDTNTAVSQEINLSIHAQNTDMAESNKEEVVDSREANNTVQPEESKEDPHPQQNKDPLEHRPEDVLEHSPNEETVENVCTKLNHILSEYPKDPSHVKETFDLLKRDPSLRKHIKIQKLLFLLNYKRFQPDPMGIQSQLDDIRANE